MSDTQTQKPEEKQSQTPESSSASRNGPESKASADPKPEGSQQPVGNVNANDSAGKKPASQPKAKQSKLNGMLSKNTAAAAKSKSPESSEGISTKVKAPGDRPAPKEREAFKVLLLDEISMGPNPRGHIDEAEFEALCESVNETGVLQPIVCRFKQDPDNKAIKYELVAGQRRFLAAKNVGISSIPAAVRTLTDEQAYSIAVSENTNRAQMLPKEVMAAYEHLVSLGVSRKRLNASLGGSAKVSKLKKISESPYWMSLVLEGEISLKDAYAGATGHLDKHSSPHASQGETDTSEEPVSDQPDSAVPTLTDAPSPIASHYDDPGVRRTPETSKSKKKRCLKATLHHTDRGEVDGHIVLSELSFEGATSEHIAFYPDAGDYEIVPLKSLTLKSAFIL
ncbi:ParB/RepB/Spo0J family partition protein [Halomonas sp. I5-271120]|uniref:ParB/RepB/Spo0J family partition protein n=1 Tax=Halomonas sp. I5-271120 TaxID=3061632 RepID=UPI0027145950|nr:ParB/RepB/Spo0J family partition protein [Halomonas sp. I5-271120]